MSISSNMTLDAYLLDCDERLRLNIPPKPLNVEQTQAVIDLLLTLSPAQIPRYWSFLIHQVPAGVDEAAQLKAAFLAKIAQKKVVMPSVTPLEAVKLLGTMLGGYNVPFLVDFLDSSFLGQAAAEALADILLIFDAFDDINQKRKKGNAYADFVIQAWARGTWFTRRSPLAEKITVTAFRVKGEINTDDLSPASDAWSRPDIPLHALCMLKHVREDIQPDEPGHKGPLQLIHSLKEKKYPLAFVGDIVGTGSSRKSATNSLVWHFGQSIPFVPNKKSGGFCIASKIAPIFFNTQEDAGVLPIEADVSLIQMGDQLTIYPYLGCIEKAGVEIAAFELKTPVLLDEVRSGGRINLILGRRLTNRARKALNLPESDLFSPAPVALKNMTAYTLAQKIVGKACGLKEGQGVLPGTYCEPHIAVVGSQDTTGPMTQDELKDLACLQFGADFVMQSFCHTVAYPKPIDQATQKTLSPFFKARGGVVLEPKDGVIHSWLNRFLVPDEVGTGADSHTRFPMGLSFPAGSGLVAFAAATGTMPLTMPESVLVRFKGALAVDITLRDLVNAIPFYAIKEGYLTLAKDNKCNVFSGRILEMEGLPHLSAEEAFELSDATAERSATACTIQLEKPSVTAYLKSNIALMHFMIEKGYEDKQALKNRLKAAEDWLHSPKLLVRDIAAKYAAVLEIDLNAIAEPLIACPNDPDDVRPLSSVSGTKIDEVFIGSCMTHIGHYRAASELLKDATKTEALLWIAPPTKIEEACLVKEGHYALFKKLGARLEVPGCSLCMGNQAQVQENATVFSTSTRNFPNRLGQGAKVFLGSAELGAICAKLGYIPSLQEYKTQMKTLLLLKDKIYRTFHFDGSDRQILSSLKKGY